MKGKYSANSGGCRLGMTSRAIGALAVLLLFLSLSLLVGSCKAPPGTSPLPPPRLRVATTTSLYDTGLWEYLEPRFEAQSNVELNVLYAGSGIAFEYGKRGDVDVLTVHERAMEEKFITEGYGIQRVPFAYNYFLIVGPASDPAEIQGMSPEEAFQKLMRSGSASFISRGDNSGTHAKEKAIWEKAGFDDEVVRKAGAWYIEAGKGMGPALLMASEKQAYTLTDVGTYLAYKGKLELVPLIDQGDLLLNVYSVIAVNPEKVPGVKIDLANKLVSFLISPEIQEFIGNYGVAEYGRSLFIPCAGKEPK